MNHRSSLVLIVDHDEAVGNAMAFSLKADGFRARAYVSARTLLQDRKLSDASCVLLNHEGGRCDSMRVALLLRRFHAGLAILLLTSRATPSLVVGARANGLALVLEKPFFNNALVCGIRSVLRGRDQPSGQLCPRYVQTCST